MIVGRITNNQEAIIELELVSLSVDSGCQRVETLAWTPAETTCGQLVHIKKFPKGHQVKVFR